MTKRKILPQWLRMEMERGVCSAIHKIVPGAGIEVEHGVVRSVYQVAPPQDREARHRLYMLQDELTFELRLIEDWPEETRPAV